MPYSNPKQPVAIFLSLKRRQGMAAAKAFARKHRDEMAKGAKATNKYRTRSRRSD